MSALTKTSLGPASFSTGSKQQLLLALNTWLGHCKNNDASITTNRLVGFINPHVFNLSFEHNVVLDFLNQTHAACVDGVGVKLALFARTGKLFPRVVAEHLFESFLHSLSFPVDAILIGGEPGAAAIAGQSMHEINSNLKIVSTLDGYSDSEALDTFILKHRTIPLILLGAGSPLSESIALRAQTLCASTVIFHIGGGTLNTYAGLKKRGPKWISQLGFEWLHRILNEPHTRQRYTSGGWQFFTNLVATRNSRPTVNGDPS